MPGLQARLDGHADRLFDDLHFVAGGRHLLEVSSSRAGRRELCSWDVATDPAHPRLRWHRPTGMVTVPISGDGESSPSTNRGGDSLRRNFATGKEIGRVGPIHHDHDFAALSPDGRLLALGRSPSSPTISVWDVATGHRKTQCDDPWTLQSFAFSPDGRYLITQCAHGLMKLWDLATGAVTMFTSPVSEAFPLTGYAFSADGRFLTTNVSPLGSPQSATIWQLDPWRQVATYPGVRGGWGLFTRDARSLILNVNEAAIRWNYSTPPEKGQPDGHADEAWSLAFSPDGSILASGCDDTDEPQTIKLWDVATGSRSRVGPRVRVRSLRWPSTPGVVSSPRRIWTSPVKCVSGTPQPAAIWRPWPATPITSEVSPSARTARPWPPPARTGASACGTSLGPGHRHARRPREHHPGGGVQPRRDDTGLRLR